MRNGVALARGSRVDLEDLPGEIRQAFPKPVVNGGTVQPLSEVEKEYILAVLELNGGNQTRLHIIGFDGETSRSARRIADTVRQGKICMAMIGLLYALPRTQLTRRLMREHRLDQTVTRLGHADECDIDQTSSS